VEVFRASAVTHLLVVSDIALSTAWYRHVLDASIYGEYGGTSVVLELAGSWILLVTPGLPTPDKPSVSFVPGTDADLVSSEIVFRVEDCRDAYRLLESRGAEFLTEPYDWGGEVRAFFRDPDGHLFEISERRD
jgi:catechol 2,3-dioxygenase-like lactoylglutathione lyase family enzyme